jgi:hypothetical protein
VVENKALGFGGADAGFEYAIWNMQYNDDYTLPQVGVEDVLSFPETINGRTVSVSIRNEGDFVYKITSTATDDEGNTVEVVSYIEMGMDFSDFFDNAITSNGDVTIKPHTNVTGNVTYSGTLYNQGYIDGAQIPVEDMNWPQTDDMIAYYWSQIEDLGLDESPVTNPYSVDISSGTEASPVSLGPLYAPGYMTTTGMGWAQFDGLIYVKGDLNIQPQSYLKMNLQTVFVEGSVNIQPNSYIEGSGCIIAVGDINFQPNMSGNEDDFLFLLSLEGTTTLKPNGDFYGSLAGSAEVELYPGNDLTWTETPEEGLNFPGGDYGGSTGSGRITQIIVYNIE